ncbi:dITP/XTP pyrophosphatase [Paraconexibacter sp. AEG42_29]|uniref:dITP/XTP pyrophosphatase n=1 Tax=Paraconexibacter sp. AEG42_29 TaxID=2997339 RepID=A0AAU7AZ73_9ACTN
MRLVLATRNAHKADEFGLLLAGHEVAPLPDEVVLPPETGQTFTANARIKAQAAATALGVAVIADDSGIVAAALGGRPGVYSARYAGPDATAEENLAKLLAEAPAGSPVAYVCAIVLIDPATGTDVAFEGRCTGVLDDDPRGTEGFGYDPAFRPDDIADGRTMAQLSPTEKAAISHRGRAARELAAWLAVR